MMATWEVFGVLLINIYRYDNEILDGDGWEERWEERWEEIGLVLFLV